MSILPPPGLRLRAFRAIRYDEQASPDLASVLAPPYDVIDEAQREALEARDPHNVVRLILPREPDDDASSDRYTHAAALLRSWLAAGVLTVDERPALYVYQQSHDGAVSQRGLFGAVVMQPLDGGVILPHENVRSGPVEDRLALMRATQANPEPIFLLYDGGGAATRISAETAAGEPIMTARTPDGVRHDLWPITDPTALAEIDDDLIGRRAMIADGHHRYTTYGYLRDELTAQHGSGPWDAGLTLLVDESVAAPDIRAIHRAIPGLPLDDAVERARAVFTVSEFNNGASIDDALRELAGRRASGETGARGPAFVVSDGARFVLLSEPSSQELEAARPRDHTRAWWALDASIASVLLMERLWGVTDAAGQVEAEHDPHAALRLAAANGGIALFLNPAPLRDIVAVAEAGDAMPRKSTLFLPKPCSGIVMRAFRYELGDDAPAGSDVDRASDPDDAHGVTATESE